MSEFKFACPVCGQHITADAAAAGSELDCPTCFRKLIIPQPPATSESKFILTAMEASKPRPGQLAEPGGNAPVAASQPSRRYLPTTLLLAIVAVVAAAAVIGWSVFRHRHSGSEAQNGGNTPGVRHWDPRSGGIGVGTWNTTAEFTNVVVSRGGQVLFRSDFGKGGDEWLLGRGRWLMTNGVLRQTFVTADCRATARAGVDWTNYVVRLKARKLAGREGFLVLFHVADRQNWAWWNIGGWNNTRNGLEESRSGVKRRLTAPVPGQVDSGRWYDVRIELDGRDIRCYLDDVLVQSAQYPEAEDEVRPPP